MANNYKFGWRPDLPDYRDFVYPFTLPLAALPKSIDLRKFCTPVYNQGSLGSCTAQAIAGAMETLENFHKTDPRWMPSRLFIYYNERVLLGTVNEDSGAYIRDGIKSLVKWGVCPEPMWPHNVKDFKKKPSKSAFKAAIRNTIDEYQRVPQTLQSLKTALANNYPIVFGFTVYESFMSEKVRRSGLMPMPKDSESAVGGHAVVAVGYDDSQKRFLCRNSWGSGFGQKGYFWMPYEYLVSDDLSADLWIIKVL